MGATGISSIAVLWALMMPSGAALSQASRGAGESRSPVSWPSSLSSQEEAETRREIDALAIDVAAVRGHDWKQSVVVRLLPDEEFLREVRRVSQRHVIDFVRELGREMVTMFATGPIDSELLIRVLEAIAERDEGLLGAELIGLYDDDEKVIS